MYDTASNTHVCNGTKQFTKTRDAGNDSFLSVGDTTTKIEAYSTVRLEVNSPNGTRTVDLLDTAYVPGFYTNLVSSARLSRKGVHIDTEQKHLHTKGNTICMVQSAYQAYGTSTQPKPDITSIPT
jgi:hypothetical protein